MNYRRTRCENDAPRWHAECDAERVSTGAERVGPTYTLRTTSHKAREKAFPLASSANPRFARWKMVCRTFPDDTILDHTHYHIVRSNLNTFFPLRSDLVLGRAGRRTSGRGVRRAVLMHLALVLGRRRVLLLQRGRRAGGLHATTSALPQIRRARETHRCHVRGRVAAGVRRGRSGRATRDVLAPRGAGEYAAGGRHLGAGERCDPARVSAQLGHADVKRDARSRKDIHMLPS
jgi:hypothetical protein